VTRAYVGIGANLGEREETVRRAAALVGARRLSALRETEPWGLADQPLFVNAVAELETELSARALLERLLETERELGRVRTRVRWGPRTIDLDLLIYGRQVIDEPDLTVPHPLLHERRFVLEPLAQLRPDLVLPGQGRSVRELLVTGT